MSDSYITSQATLKCSFGDCTCKLTVYPDRTVYLNGKPMANISDHVSMYNIHPFGKCHTTNYPPTGSATSANHGCLTPMPCVPGTVSDWINGKADYIVKGKPALLKSSFCKCKWGGVITITNDGQTDTGNADLNREALKSEEEILKRQEDDELAENETLDTNEVLDGIQTALDFAGFAPGIGAVPDLLNAAISACRGNWTEAGLSVLAAIPGVGDAAAGVKIANRGVKIAKAARKAENIGEVAKTVSNSTKVEGISVKATKADGVVKQVSKTGNEATSLSDYRKAKQERLIDESSSVKKIPKQKTPFNASVTSMEKGKSGDLVKLGNYERKEINVGNGKTETILIKKQI